MPHYLVANTPPLKIPYRQTDRSRVSERDIDRDRETVTDRERQTGKQTQTQDFWTKRGSNRHIDKEAD